RCRRGACWPRPPPACPVSCAPSRPLTSESWLLAALEGPHGLLPGINDLTDIFHTNQVENHADGRGDSAQLEVAAGRRYLLQARQDRPTAAAVHEPDSVQVEDELATVLQ